MHISSWMEGESGKGTEFLMAQKRNRGTSSKPYGPRKGSPIELLYLCGAGMALI